jgi:uncharacterized membrane protein
MKQTLRPLTTTLIGGVVFLLPLVVVLAVLGQALALVAQAAAPLMSRFEHVEVAGVTLAGVLTIAILLLLCFGAGLLARAAFGRALSERFEDRLQALYPRYTVIKGMAHGFAGVSTDDGLKSVLITFDDHQLLALEVERMGDGRVVIFVPGSPDPWSGNVLLVAPERVQPLAASVAELNHALKGIGHHCAPLLEGRLRR